MNCSIFCLIVTSGIKSSGEQGWEHWGQVRCWGDSDNNVKQIPKE